MWRNSVRNKPIVIIGLPRSGTSMVAGIFAHHGVFAGTCKEADNRNAKGFFEHIGFTELILKLYGKGRISQGDPVRPHPSFKRKMLELIDQDGYEGGPWMIKHAQVYHKVWEDFEPSFVFVRRDTASIADSAQELGWRGGSTSLVIKGQQLINRLAEESGAPQVISNELINGNYASLLQAFEYCGLVFNEGIAAKFIDPSLWRKRGPKSLDEDPSVIMRDKNYLKPNHKRGQKHA